MKKLFLFIFFLVFGISLGYSADFYTLYNLHFSDIKSNSIFLNGGKCVDTKCSNVNSKSLTFYNGKTGLVCFQDFIKTKDVKKFNTCMDKTKVTGNILDLTGISSVITKVKVPSSFGNLIWFSPSKDSYIPQFFRTTNYNCNFNICYEPTPKDIYFTKKANAIAKINKLNIINTNNKLLPVQITVPVSISQTVCSAYQLTQPNMYKPQIPNGYSDFSANTKISLNINQVSDGSSLYSKTITIPILADKCAGLASFSWKPDSFLENKKVDFKVSSLVIDNQVSSTIPDHASSRETVYPINLDGTCWARSKDFLISNVKTQNLNTGIAQITKITQGNLVEDAYALFTAGAFTGNSVTPIPFKAIISIDGVVVKNGDFNSGKNLKTYNSILTQQIKNLKVGPHRLTLDIKPQGSSCTLSKDVIQTLNLEILKSNTINAKFHVTDLSGKLISNAKINLDLVKLAGHYSNSNLIYNKDILTDSNGIATFKDLQPGNYNYIAKKNGLVSVTSNVNINTNSDYYITLSKVNSKPIINLPKTLSGYYLNPIKINLKDYVTDYNDAFNTLSFSPTVISGTANVNINKGNLLISTYKVGSAVINVKVIDPEGASSQDSILVHFTGNKKVIVNSFTSTPDNGGSPLITTFNLNLNNPDTSLLSCKLDFGDGKIIYDNTKNCNKFNGIKHTYNLPNTYVAKLTIDDGFNPTINKLINIYVFKNNVVSSGGPVINKFTLTSSNGNKNPTNLVLNWKVTNSLNLVTTCSLNVNGVSSPVNCISSKTYLNYKKGGLNTFTLTAIDSKLTQVSSTKKISINKIIINPISVNSFTATPNKGIAPLVSKFSFLITNLNKFRFKCVLDFGDGNIIYDNSGNCNSFYKIKHTYNLPNNYTAKLIINDGINPVIISSTNIEVIKSNIVNVGGPVINKFTLDSSNGNQNPTDLVLNWNITNTLNLSTTCSLSLNGISSPVNCISSKTYLNYNNSGLNTFTLSAIDINSKGVSASKVINLNSIFINPITINSFTATPDNGVAPLVSTFSFLVNNPSNTNITCKLDFGDGNFVYDNSPNCNGFNGISHTYNLPNIYTAKLIINDGINPLIKSNVLINVSNTSINNNELKINKFTISSSNGLVSPSNLRLDWNITNDGLSNISCYLINEGISLPVNCISNKTYFNYNKVGISNFTILAIDSKGIVSKTNKITLENLNDLLARTNLEINNIIIPGKFHFGISIKDEKFTLRTMKVAPSLVCNGVENKYKDNYLNTLINSRKGTNKTYLLFTNTRDFNLKVPVNTPCDFKVKLEDNLGIKLTLSKSVEFQYPQKLKFVTSIRGKGTDVVNYLTSTLAKTYDIGYNSIEFNLKNNGNTGKKMSISLMSSKLQFSKFVTLNIPSKSMKRVQIPLYVDSSIKNGRYPIRISVYDGNDKQTRYSYININN